LKCYELQGLSGIDGLTLVDKPVTQPGEGQVLVRLKAATLNLMIKGGYGSRQKFPLVPLSDGAGVIEAVGSCVQEFVVGERVIGSFFESCKSSQTADVIDKSFLRRTALCSRGARATARQRAGRQLQVMPHARNDVT
jgi:NADPH:quinone reductase-like Zn-dependent oxidoreductase